MPKTLDNYRASDLVSIRLSGDDAELVNALISKSGLNVTALFRMGIRSAAEQLNVKLQKQATLKKRPA